MCDGITTERLSMAFAATARERDELRVANREAEAAFKAACQQRDAAEAELNRIRDGIKALICAIGAELEE